MKKPTVLILHGWGVGGGAYRELCQLLKDRSFSVFVPDLPGFGKEPLTKKNLTLDDYLDFTKNFIKKNIQGKYVLIGHSFGGRITIKLAASRPSNLSQIILTGAAGIVHPLSFRSKLAFFFAKSGSMLTLVSPFREFLRKFLYHVVGEFDYYKAGKLKKTFQNIIAEDLSGYLPKISASTLLVWGENDFVIPPSDGESMRQKIKNSELIVVSGARHNFPYSMPHVFVEKILPFLEK